MTVEIEGWFDSLALVRSFEIRESNLLTLVAIIGKVIEKFLLLRSKRFLLSKQDYVGSSPTCPSQVGL